MKTDQVLAAGLMAAVLLAGAATGARAATGISVTSFNFGSGVDSFQAFDPSLGTLISVNVDISGEFHPLILSDVAGQVEPLFITRRYDGFAGRGFTTLSGTEFQGFILTGEPGSPALAFAPFREQFTVTALSELIGFTPTSAGGSMRGILADFLPGGPNGALILEFPSYVAYAFGAQGGFLPSISTFATGGGLVTYTYEIATPGVPEPAAWALMVAGFGLAGAGLRRGRTGAARG